LLTEQLGNVHLEKHLASVITLMRISPTWPDFERFMMKAFPDRTIPSTLELPFKDTTPLWLSRRLKALQMQGERTQEALGERAGLNEKYLGAIERGERNPSVKQPLKLA
jgi:DNA-binding XRE family transcriptional regulator